MSVWSAPRSESPDVVFSPYLVTAPKFGEVYEYFKKQRGRALGETCKKATKPGDLYLFYFGKPQFKIAGLAVCAHAHDPKDSRKRDGASHKKMFFCDFDLLHHCRKPVTADELRTNEFFNSWWKTKPFRGGPKTIRPNVAAALLELIATREPKVANLLRGYIDLDAIPKKDATRGALEGTLYELLSTQRVRSQMLRDSKIRHSMDANDGHLPCEVPGCRFDFFQTYGELGRGFAHVHHRRSLAERKTVRTTLADLAIVCANCHAMIHRRGRCRSLQRLIVAG